MEFSLSADLQKCWLCTALSARYLVMNRSGVRFPSPALSVSAAQTVFSRRELDSDFIVDTTSTRAGGLIGLAAY